LNDIAIMIFIADTRFVIIIITHNDTWKRNSLSFIARFLPILIVM